jgi:uncharacterized protein involved in exopolysaccharide biosynthesis
MSKSSSRSSGSAPSLGIGDIVYVLFKHKWKLIAITLLGWTATLAYYFLAPPVFTSMAKLMVRYVVERSALDHVENTSSGSGREVDSIIISELEILTSWDLAAKVAAVPGMERVIPNSEGPVNSGAVASVISDSMFVKAVPGSNVIQVYFKHRNPEMAQKVLDELIRQYFIKHLDVHRSKEAAKFVSEKVEQSRTKLRSAEEDITKLKVDNGILSLADAMKSVSDEMARTETELGDSETALAEQRARVAGLEHYLGETVDKTKSPSSSASQTPLKEEVRTTQTANAAAGASPATDDSSSAESSLPKPSAVELSQYQSILAKLFELKSADLKLAEKWAPDSQAMRQHRERIAKFETERLEMMKKYPELAMTARNSTGNQGSRIDLFAERAQLDALEAKVTSLREALAKARKKVSELTLLAPKITEKERAAAIEEINYRYMGSSLEKAQIDEALDSSKIPNICIVQEATPPVLDLKRRNQIAIAGAVAVPALAIGFALLFGLILNRTVKRAQDLETRMGLPLVLSIPYFPRRGRMRARLGKSKGGSGADWRSSNGDLVPWDKEHFIFPYAEAVRDRLCTFFEMQRIADKPKLIGVSSFSARAGVSTLAAGLAAALSATDGNKVLLMDMNGGGSAGQPFSAGKPSVLGDVAPAGDDKISPADGDLHLATMKSGSSDAAAPGLSEFRRMMFDLKSGGSDYLVFDLPPISEISPSAAMAGLMDHVLVVVESEATIAEQVKRGYRDLVAAHAAVSVVFNKARSYGPQALVGA